MKRCPKGSQNNLLVQPFLAPLFSDFHLGAPGVPKEATKQPRYRQGTQNGRPKVPKGLKGVWKWSPKVAKSVTISAKRLCDDNVNGETHKQTNKQTTTQASTKANKQIKKHTKQKG